MTKTGMSRDMAATPKASLLASIAEAENRFTAAVNYQSISGGIVASTEQRLAVLESILSSVVSVLPQMRAYIDESEQAAQNLQDQLFGLNDGVKQLLSRLGLLEEEKSEEPEDPEPRTGKSEDDPIEAIRKITGRKGR